MRKVLLVDDDEDFRTSLKEQLLLQREFEIEEANNGKDALALATKNRFDLIILDVDLPELDGRETCKLIRSSGVTSPVIMLTGQTTDADTILGLDSGANDYVTKPFRIGVLLARMRAQLRQHEHSEDAEFRIGPYRFIPSRKLLEHENGQKVRLTEKEMLILKFLYRAQPQVVTRDVLLNEVWGYNSEVTTHTLETHIYRLRQKIEQDKDEKQIIVTEVGGYKISL